MACVTLKRPLEWQDPSMSPEHGHGHMGGSPGGSPTSMIISNSPPHHSGGGGGVGAGGSCSSSYSSPFSPMGGVPNKRACLGSGIVHSTASSPFRATEQIRDEMLRLKMVRDRFVAANHSLQQQQQQLQKSASSQTISISPVKRPSTSSSSVATSVSSHSSPSSSSSSSSTVVPVETRNNTPAQQQQQPSATLLSVREIFLKAAAQSRTAGHHHHHHHPNQPVFSLDEVVPIVERLLAEQEEHLRLLLQERLAEQYDQFRRFTADQLLVQAKARAMEQANQEGGGSSHVSYLS